MRNERTGDMGEKKKKEKSDSNENQVPKRGFFLGEEKSFLQQRKGDGWGR